MKAKPKYLEATYASVLRFDIKEVESALSISWEDVSRYWVKWCNLYVQTGDGKIHKFSADGEDPYETDFSVPEKIELLDDNLDPIKDNKSIYSLRIRTYGEEDEVYLFKDLASARKTVFNYFEIPNNSIPFDQLYIYLMAKDIGTFSIVKHKVPS